jgi:phenylpyruvate tautomerase PptA (4-oxalocrotonate tautomerase family)
LIDLEPYGASEDLRITRTPWPADSGDVGGGPLLCCRCVAISARQGAHRFFPLEPSEFFYPAGRTNQYTILEFSMFEGRSVEAKKKLIRLIFERFEQQLAISPQDVEVTIFETPKHNWGVRGLPGDEHVLNYDVEV